MAGFDFKKEEDVKEYLNNIYTEYSYGCYSEKNPESCHLLGDYFETIKRDFKQAAELYQKNCDVFDFSRSCAKFGAWSIVGKGCKEDLQAAYKYLQKSCEKEDLNGCVITGVLSTSVEEIHNNDKKIVNDGVKLLDKCCHQLNSEKACFHLSSVYITGIKNIVSKNFFQAYRASMKACELGNYWACRNVARMHEKGDGAAKSPKLAETFRRRAEELEKEYKKYKPQLKFSRGAPE